MRLVEPCQQLDQRGLAGPGRPDDRDFFAGRHLERNVFEDPLLVVVGEPDTLERDRSPAGRARCHVRARSGLPANAEVRGEISADIDDRGLRGE